MELDERREECKTWQEEGKEDQVRKKEEEKSKESRTQVDVGFVL